jgi:hypothetical protein
LSDEDKITVYDAETCYAFVQNQQVFYYGALSPSFLNPKVEKQLGILSWMVAIT